MTDKIAEVRCLFMKLLAVHNVPADHADHLWDLAFAAGAMKGGAEVRDIAVEVFAGERFVNEERKTIDA